MNWNVDSTGRGWVTQPHGDKFDDLGRRMDRLEGGIGTLKWIIGAEVAVIGVILAFIKAY